MLYVKYYPNIIIIICAEITLRNMVIGYTVAYATAGSSLSAIEFA